MRWWDGRTWTGHVTGPAPGQWGPPPAGAVAVRATVADELAASRWARWAPPALAVGTVATALTLGGALEELRDFLDEVFDAAGAGTVAPPAPATTAVNLASLVHLAALVCFWVWQSRAATAGRALGFPAVRTPAMGVGGWFIPVVNLWFPYQSVRDCLPPGHPDRHLSLRWWLGYVSAFVGVPATAVAVAFAPVAVGVAVAAVLVAVEVWVGWTGQRMVDAIGSTHARAAGPLGDNPT